MRYLLSVLLVMALTACGSTPSTAPKTPSKAAETQKEGKNKEKTQNPKLEENEAPSFSWYKDRVIVLNYHHIDPALQNEETISPDDFRVHMEWLKKNGFQPISLESFYDFLEGKPLEKDNAVLLTFDDGYESVYTYAFPLLREFHFPATVFMIMDHIRVLSEWKPKDKIPSLTEVQMDIMQKSGLISFQSHTYDLHGKGPASAFIKRQPNETEYDYFQRLHADFIMSRKNIEALTGKDLRGISFPYGYTNPMVLEAAKKAGFRYGFSNGAGWVTRWTELYHLPRVDVGSPEMKKKDFEDLMLNIILQGKRDK